MAGASSERTHDTWSASTASKTIGYLFAVLVFIFAGCNAVYTEGIEGFGVVWSVEWVHWERAGRESLVLSNGVGYCRKEQEFQDALQAWGDAEAEIDGSSDDYCSVMSEPHEALVEAGWELERAHAPTLTLLPAAGVFEEGVYAIPGEGGGSITDNFTNPWEVVTWNLARYGGCGGWGRSDILSMDGGTFEVTVARDNGILAGTFDVQLVADLGAASGRFRASTCTIDEADYVVPELDDDTE